MQTIGKYVFLLLILTPSHIQPLPHKYSDTDPSLFLSLSRRMLRKATTDASQALWGVKDQNTRSPAPRAKQQPAERKGAEPGARGAWEGSDRKPKTDTRQGSGFRRLGAALVPSPGPSDRCRTHLLHVTTAPTLPASAAVLLHGPRNSSERKKISQRRKLRR